MNAQGTERVIERPMIDHRSKDYAPNYRPMSDARRRDIFGQMLPMQPEGEPPLGWGTMIAVGFFGLLCVVGVMF